MSRLHRFTRAFAPALALAAGTLGGVEPPTTVAHRADLRVGLPRLAFEDLNENDAIAAYRTFIAACGRRHGYELRADVAIYDTLPELERAVRTGRVQLVVMGSWQLLEAQLQDAVEPAYLPVVNGEVSNRQFLVVRRRGGMADLAALRGKAVLALLNANNSLSRLWLETLCLADSGNLPGQFFGRLDYVGKPSAAILPVFFGRSDAAVVDEHSFATACELNPQLRRDLIAIARSEPMVSGVICLNRRGWASPQEREDLRTSLAELHLEATGRQILTLFHLDRLVPFEPGELASVAALTEQHERLSKGGAAARPPVSAAP